MSNACRSARVSAAWPVPTEHVADVLSRTRMPQPALNARRNSHPRRCRSDQSRHVDEEDPSHLSEFWRIHAIGQEIQNGVSHAGSARRAPRVPSVSSACADDRNPTFLSFSRDAHRSDSATKTGLASTRKRRFPYIHPSPLWRGGTHVLRDASRFPAYTRFPANAVACSACVVLIHLATRPTPRSQVFDLITRTILIPFGKFYICLTLTHHTITCHYSSNIHTCTDYSIYSARNESDLA